MAEKKIGATIVLNGEKEFRSAVTSCNKALSTMKSEMNLVKAQTSGQANTLESLKKKHEVLNKTLEATKQKEQAVANGLSNAKDNYSKIGSELTEYKTRLEAAKKELERMKASGTATDEQLKAQEKTVSDLTNTVARTESSYQKAGDKVNDWQKQLNNAQAQVISANSAVEENAKYMKEAETASDGCATSIDEYGKKISSTDEKLEQANENIKKLDFSSVVQAWETIGNTLSSVGSKAYDAALELDEGYDTIVTKTGATGDALDELTDVANNIFGELPTTMADVGTAVGEVNTRFGLTGDELQNLSEQFIEFAEINGTDLNNAVDTVDKMIKQFGLDTEDATEVLGIMTKRGQETGISMDTLMSSISSNSATLKELGFGIEESINLLAQFEINGIETSTALRSLKTAVNESTDGTLTAREALEQTIESIKNAETSTEALAIAQEMFGTKGAQVMVDGIQSGRINLDTLADSLNNYSTTVSETYETTLDPWDKLTVATNNLKTAGSELASEALGTLEPALSKLATVTQTVSKAFSKAPTSVKTVVGVIGALGVGVGTVIPKLATFKKSLDVLGITDKISKAIKSFSSATEAASVVTEAATAATEVSNTVRGISTGLTEADTIAKGAQTVATVTETVAAEGATVAQEGLNVAMSSCPVLAIVTGVAAAATAIALFAANASTSKSELDLLKESAEEAIDTLKESQEGLEDAMGTASDSVADAQASGVIADEVADKLMNLASKTSLTSDEQAELAVCVAQLNKLYPDLGLKIDSVTGELNKSNEEIEAQIANLKNLSFAQAYQEAYEEIIEGVTDAQKELIKATSEQKKVDAQIKSVGKDIETVTKLMDESTDGVIEWNGEYRTGTEVLADLNQQQYDLTQTQEELTGTIEENKAVVEEAQETANGYYETYTELTDAQNTNTDATNANTDAQNAAAEAHQYRINTAGEAAAAFNSLSEADQESAVRVANSITELTNSVEGTLASQMSMFEQFNAGTETTKEQILSNMQSQVEGVTAWEQNMNTLMTATKTAADGTQVAISEGLMQYLASLGPEGSTYVQEFVNMSGDELAKANELWEQSVDIQGMTNDLGLQLQDNIGSLSAGSTEAFAALGEELGVQASEAGGYIGQGLVEGLNNAKSEIEAAGEDAGNSVIESLDEAAGVQSPSRKTKMTGRYLVRGLQMGIQNNQDLATSQGSSLAYATVAAINSKATTSSTYTHGYYLAYGLSIGIRNNQYLAVNAATELAEKAIAAAKKKLEINSPSHVFQRLGSGVVEGFVKGVDDNAYDATATIRDAMDFSNVSAKIGNNEGLTNSISAAITASNSNADLLKKIDALYNVVSMYLPDAGNIYLDGAAVSKKITGYQNKDAAIRRKITGVV